MNANQRFPGNGSPVPVLVVIGLGFALVNWLLSDDKAEKPETATAKTETENSRKEAETPPKTPAFRPSPAEIPAKPAIIPIHSAPAPVFPPLSAAPVPKISVPVPVPTAVASPKIAAQIPLPPTKKKFVTRADLATVFHNGARSLTRTAAVAALKSLGFGKTAAYAALSPNGRFSAWLRVASDEIITWTA